jgi:hypothetical protein
VRFYKTGSDFAADMKRQIAAVRKANGGKPPVIRWTELRVIPNPDAPDDPNRAIRETINHAEPAGIRPREYHRLGGVA